MTDNISTKLTKIVAILGSNLVVQTLIYLTIARLGLDQEGGFYLFGAFVTTGLIYVVGTIALIFILAVFIISGTIVYKWINDSAKAKRLYTLIILLLIFIQWSLGFILIEWVAKNLWRINFIRIFS